MTDIVLHLLDILREQMSLDTFPERVLAMFLGWILCRDIPVESARLFKCTLTKVRHGAPATEPTELVNTPKKTFSSPIFNS